MLGILQEDPSAWPRSSREGAAQETEGRLTEAEIETLIVARTEARKARNFAESDRIRDLLVEGGVLLEDSAKGTTWRWR